MQIMSVFFFGHGQPLEHQHDCPTGRADVDRLIGSVQNQNRSLHEQALARRWLRAVPRSGAMMVLMAFVSRFVTVMPGPATLPTVIPYDPHFPQIHAASRTRPSR